jgi:hypothetical protein
MTQDTAAVKPLNPQARLNTQTGLTRDERLMKFEALAAFANLGDEPTDWWAFRAKWPDFFPTTPSGIDRSGFRTLSEWLYTSAEEWNGYPPEAKAKAQTPLLYYRDRLRAVWTNNDPYGANLGILLGFEGRPDWLVHIIMKNAAAKGETQMVGIIRDITEKEAHIQLAVLPPVMRPAIIPGQPTGQEKTFAGLPEGRPIVNAVTGSIDWEFGCEFQQNVYDLMKSRWRAKTCLECGKYFVADKPNSKYCSTGINGCFGAMRRRVMSDYWREVGSKKRAERKAKATKGGRR